MLIRTALVSDSQDILNWRNDKISREMSFNNNIITPDKHKAWFLNSLKNPAITMYVGEEKNYKIGICRFDIHNDYAFTEVSININPLVRGKGYAKKFLQFSINTYFKKKKNKLIAQTKKKNLASIKIFKAAGFYLASKSEDKLILKRD